MYDIDPGSHRALSNLFGQHIVLSGRVERHWGSVIGRLADLRLATDCDIRVIFSEADASGACQQADAFANRIHTLLISRIAPELLGQRRN